MNSVMDAMQLNESKEANSNKQVEINRFLKQIEDAEDEN